MVKKASIVVPAHNESKTITRLLDRFDTERYEVVVVANGCTDDTAAIAREAAPEAIVLDLERGDKPSALNAADDVAVTFPRAYIDADVDITEEALEACIDELERGALAVAPKLEVDTTGSSALVRSYYRVWTRMPWVTQDLVGSGVFILSEEGRARFGAYPDVGADDLWVASHFLPGERRSIATHSFTVKSSRTLRQVIRRRSRITAADRLLRQHAGRMPGDAPSENQALLKLLRHEPGRAGDVFVYMASKAVAALRAIWMIRSGDVQWHGDDR